MIGADQRILRVEDIVVDRAMVRVHDGFDAVPNVVELTLKGRGVRITVRNRVSILNPEQTAVGHHAVGFTVPHEKGSHRGEAFLNRTTVLDEAVRIDFP